MPRQSQRLIHSHKTCPLVQALRAVCIEEVSEEEG